jgi:hypothetical protein
MVLTSSHAHQFSTRRSIISSWPSTLNASTIESRNGA